MSDDEEVTLETIKVQDALIQKYERQIKGLERKLTELTEKIGKLTEASESQLDRESKLSKTVDKYENSIKKLMEQKDQLDKELESKDEQLSELGLEIREKIDALLVNEKQLGGYEVKFSHLTEEIEEKTQENLALKVEIKALQNERLELSNKLSRFSGILEEVRKKSVEDYKKLEEYRAHILKMEEIINEREVEIEKLKSLNVDGISQASELNKEIEDLKVEKIDLENKNNSLKNQLTHFEDTIEENKQLKKVNNELETQLKELQKSQAGVITGREKIMRYVKDQLTKTISKILITAPNIMDLRTIVEDLKIQKAIQISIATHVNPEINQHAEILEKLKRMDIIVQNYPKEDRWCLERDSTEVLLANSGINPTGIIVVDTEFITLLRKFLTEPWLGGRRL